MSTKHCENILRSKTIAKMVDKHLRKIAQRLEISKVKKENKHVCV